VNWGLTLATAEVIVLVNNDCLLERECVARLVAELRSSGSAAVSGRLVDLEHPGQLASAFSLADSIRAGSTLPPGTSVPVRQAVAESQRNHGYSVSGSIVHDAFGESRECFYPSGGLMAIRRSAIPHFPQLFPHRYFAYHEDAWLGFALRSRGLTVGKEPGAVAIHRAGSTARSLGRARLRFLQERNRWLNLLGWLPGDALLKLMPLYLVVNLLTLLALIPRPADFLGWLGAQLWLASRPLELIRWRAQCQAGVEVPPEALTERLSGAVRGRGGMLNALSRWWCKVTGIRTLETTQDTKQGAHQHG
jgi:GT2 family glycosyltransferase